MIGAVPLGSWQTITFVAALRHNKMTAPMVTEGAMTGELFLGPCHDTARFERVADDLDQAEDRAIAACDAGRKLADLSFEHSNPHLVLFFHRCPFECSFRIC